MFLLAVICTLFSMSSQFTPVWIGKQFNESSFVSYEENSRISDICGRVPKGATTDHPWAVSIMLNGQNRLGGSIISPFHILTVAHGFMQLTMGAGTQCLVSAYRSLKELRDKRVVVYGGKCIRGESNHLPNHPECLESDVIHNKIKSVLVDGSFANFGCQNGHDFAIIEVEKRMEFSSRVSPICLPPEIPSIDPVLTVAGWGRSYIFSESGPMIHVAPMRIDKYCRRPWSDKFPSDAPDILCATSLNISDYYSPRICHGDSGSGMEQRDEKGRATLIAMTSFGTKGCPSNLLARFTRVNLYLRQICAYTGLCYSKR